MLPAIRSNAEVYGHADERGPLRAGTPIAGSIGDQQAAMVGQACLREGDAKNTYGTGLFVVLNTGQTVKRSRNGLISTVCFQIGSAAPVYALEGSIAIGGALVQWLRDNLGIIDSAADIEALAASVPDNGGVYFVPAFSGLYAPYWRKDARGVIAGMTRFATGAHIARAALEATAYQTRDVLEAMLADSGEQLRELKADGGMVANELLMQFQADVLGVPIVRPKNAETTALGAAYMAGLAVGFWDGPDRIMANWTEERRWAPNPARERFDSHYRQWKKAVTRTFDWAP
jgi:glycerol kinase